MVDTGTEVHRCSHEKHVAAAGELRDLLPTVGFRSHDIGEIVDRLGTLEQVADRSFDAERRRLMELLGMNVS